MKIDPTCPDCELPTCPGFGCIARITLGPFAAQSTGRPARPFKPCPQCGGEDFKYNWRKTFDRWSRACRPCRNNSRRSLQDAKDKERDRLARSEHPALRRTA